MVREIQPRQSIEFGEYNGHRAMGWLLLKLVRWYSINIEITLLYLDELSMTKKWPDFSCMHTWSFAHLLIWDSFGQWSWPSFPKNKIRHNNIFRLAALFLFLKLSMKILREKWWLGLEYCLSDFFFVLTKVSESKLDPNFQVAILVFNQKISLYQRYRVRCPFVLSCLELF